MEALREIYEREFDFVWTCLRRLGIPPRNLPDVTHDAFLAVSRGLPNFDPTRPMRPWLAGVCFRVASDYLRLSRNSQELLDAYPESIPDSRSLPDRGAEAAEQWRYIEAGMATLTLGLRGVLVMHDFLGYSGSEVARTLGIPLKTVFSRLRSARTRIVLSTRALRGALEVV
jgi:RNA polymerase sigma-70 factor, ECF subfamily